MNLFNVTKRLVPMMFIFASITGTILFTILYLTNTIVSPQWAVLFSLPGIITILFTRLNKKSAKKQQKDVTNYSDTNPRILCILDLIFYIGLTALLLSLLTNEIRSIPYIILLSILAVTITASTLLSSKKSIIHHALIKTIFLFGTASLSIFKIFYWTGRDTWTHASWNYQLAQEGWLFAELGKELTNPLYHIAVAITEILPSLDVRTATIISVTIPLIILYSLGVFTVARRMIGLQYAVIAVIIADFIGFIPYWSSWGQSTTYACMVFVTMLIPLFRLLTEEHIRHTGKWIVLFLLFVFIISLTHLYSTFILTLYLGGVLLSWFVVDVFLNQKINLTPLLSVISGLVIACGYSIVTNLSFMLPVFQQGINKLMGKYKPPTHQTSNELVSGVSSPVISNTETIDTLVSTDIINSIQNSITIIEPNIWSSFVLGGLQYVQFLIPLIVGCLFVVQYCFKPKIHGFKRSIWYLLIPSLMIVFLLFVTTFAYPSMTGRPYYYMPIFLGLIVASIIWWYVTREGKCKQISKSSLGVIFLIVFLVVSFGTFHTMEEKGGGVFMEQHTSQGHYASEVYGLETILSFIPEEEPIYTDYEMKSTVRYVLKNDTKFSNIKQNILNTYTADSSDGYIIFKESLTKGVTYTILWYGGLSLAKEGGLYTVDSKYGALVDEVTSNVYENGELVVWDLSHPGGN